MVSHSIGVSARATQTVRAYRHRHSHFPLGKVSIDFPRWMVVFKGIRQTWAAQRPAQSTSSTLRLAYCSGRSSEYGLGKCLKAIPLSR